jgi:membrane-bound lytic murein transglycosylase B
VRRTLRSRLTHDRVMRCGMTLLVVTITFALAACSGSTSASTAPTATATPPTVAIALPPVPRRLASSDPVQLADDLVADEQALCDAKSSEAVLMGAAGRQQAAYRALGRHPEWDVIARPRIPPSLLNVYDRNVDAQRQFTAIVASEPKDTLPAWRIDPPAPTNKLLGYYREAEAATGVGWNYLAAINLIETGLGRVVGVSDAGAQGPMQFLPSTFADYGDGGDILSPHDSIMAGIVKLLARCGAARIGRCGDCGNVQGLSVPDRNHRARGVAVSPFCAEPARRRGTDAGPRCGGHLRDDPLLVCQVRAGLRQQAASAPTPPRRQMAPR